MKFKIQENIGRAKYLVSFSDGSKEHNDGSEFWDIKIFKSKKKMNIFLKDLMCLDK